MIAFTVLAALLSLIVWTDPTTGRTFAVGSGLLAVLLIAFACKALGINYLISRQIGRGPVAGLFSAIIGSWLGPWVIAVGTAGALMWWLDEQWTWMPFAVGFGTLVHILGDALTVEGVPFLWPWNPAPPKGTRGIAAIMWQRNGYFRFPILGHTTSFREAVFAALLAIYAFYILAYELITLAGIDNTGTLLR